MLLVRVIPSHGRVLTDWHSIRTQHSLMRIPRIPRESNSTFLHICRSLSTSSDDGPSSRSSFGKEDTIEGCCHLRSRSARCRSCICPDGLGGELSLFDCSCWCWCCDFRLGFAFFALGACGKCWSGGCSDVCVGILSDVGCRGPLSTGCVLGVKPSDRLLTARLHKEVGVDARWWMSVQEFGIHVVLENVSCGSRCIGHTK